MNIAILGSRGIPANYGGFETCAEELATRLVKRGHQATVYCCKGYCSAEPTYYKGVRRVVLPTIYFKALEKPVFTTLSLLHVTLCRMDVVLVLGLSAVFFCFVPKLVGQRVVINVDGLEWQRKKWGRFISTCFLLSERAASFIADRLVTDARCIQEYYARRYGEPTTCIPYGVDAVRTPSDGTLKSLGAVANEYVLFVSRFERENNPLRVRRAFERVKTEKRLVMLGSAPYASDYGCAVRDTKDARIAFPGGIYGRGYQELQSHAYVYVQATEVGGTHPALVEAIGFGNCIIANDVPEHREVLGDAGLYYDGTEAGLAHILQAILNQPELVAEYRKRARERAQRYSWDAVVTNYETLFSSLLSGK